MRIKLPFNLKFTITAMVILFFVSLATLILLNKKPICIDSKIIGKIDRVTKDNTYSAYQCLMSKQVAFDEKLFQRAPEFSRRIADIQRFFDDVLPLKTLVEISWLDNSNSMLRVQGNKIFISDDLLAKSPILEASLIRIWLRENSSSLNLDRTLLESALTDLILFSLGKLKTDSMTDFQWPSHLKTAMQACQSKDIPADLIFLCSGSDFSSEAIFIGSARPLISHSLIAAFSKLSLQDSHDMIKQLPMFLKLLSTIPGSAVFTSEDTLLNQLSKVESEVAKINSFFTQSMNALISLNDEKGNLWVPFLNSFIEEMKKRGWSEDSRAQKTTGSLKLEHLILMEAGLDIDFDFLKRMYRNQNENELNAIIVDRKIWFPSSMNWLPLSSISELSAYSIMNISCTLPTHAVTRSLLNRSEKVLFVKRCDPSLSINIRGFLKNSFVDFAKENPKLAFYQVHSPSALQAAKSNFDIPFENIEKNDLSHPFFNSVGWVTSEWHKNGKFFEAKSVIQAIQAYRL